MGSAQEQTPTHKDDYGYQRQISKKRTKRSHSISQNNSFNGELNEYNQMGGTPLAGGETKKSRNTNGQMIFTTDNF